MWQHGQKVIGAGMVATLVSIVAFYLCVAMSVAFFADPFGNTTFALVAGTLFLALFPCTWAITFWYCWRAMRPIPPPGVCIRCEYDLTGNVSGVCPECGERVPDQTRREDAQS